MPTDHGLVSIVTASYNSADFIADTIKSVQSQSYSNWEMIITDDCSTDSSVEIIEKFAAEDPRIRLIRLNRNSGPGVCRNTSIRNAKGRFIAFCDSDDRWLPDKLRAQLDFMVEKGAPLSYTSYYNCDTKGNIIGFADCLPKMNFMRIIRDNGIGCLTAVYDRSITGLQEMPEMRKRQDWCLWINIIRRFGPAVGLRRPLAIYRTVPGSISSSKLKLIRYNIKVYQQTINAPAPLAVGLFLFYFTPYHIFKIVRQKWDFMRLKKQKKSISTLKGSV